MILVVTDRDVALITGPAAGGGQSGVPHLLLVGARAEVVSKFIGLPVALTVVQQPGRDTRLERLAALAVQSLDFTDVRALARCARQIHDRRRIDAVLSLTESGLLPASMVAEELGVRANPVSAVATTLDKPSMRQLLWEKGIDATRHVVCAGLDEALHFAGGVRGPIVLKPRGGAGSAGVALARRAADVPAAWEWCSTAGFSSIIAEEYIEGHEYSVETMSAAGRHCLLAITDKYTTGPPHFIEIGHDELAQISAEESGQICHKVFGALDAIGHQWGPCHTEVITGGDTVNIVEINARIGGDQIWEMVELATGIDVVAATVQALLSATLPLAPREARGAAVRFLAPPPGRVRQVSGIDQAQSIAGVIRIADLPEVGDTVRPLASSGDRAGYVLAVGPDLAAAAAAASAAVRELRIETG